MMKREDTICTIVIKNEIKIFQLKESSDFAETIS